MHSIAATLFVLIAIAAARPSVRAPSTAKCAGPITVTVNGAAQQWQLATASWANGVSGNGASATLQYNDRAYIVPSCEDGAWRCALGLIVFVSRPSRLTPFRPDKTAPPGSRKSPRC